MSDEGAAAPRGTVCDTVGALLLAGLAGWAVATAEGRPADPGGTLLAILAVATGYAVGRIAGAVLPLGSLVAPAVAAAVAVAALPRGLSGDPSAPPLHDAGANGALLTLAVGAACCAAHQARPGRLRGLLVLLALALTGEAAATGSVAGLLGCGGVLAVSAAVSRTRARRTVLVLLAGCVVLTGAVTLLLADRADGGATGPGAGGGVAAEPVSWNGGIAAAPEAPGVTDLWHTALRELRAEPLRGVGPGQFAAAAPTAQVETGADGASSAALETAAEEGLPGLALLAAAFVWALWALARSPRGTAAALSAGAALAALGAQAVTGSVLSHTGVTAAAGLLLGLAVARPLAAEAAPPR